MRTIQICKFPEQILGLSGINYHGLDFTIKATEKYK